MSIKKITCCMNCPDRKRVFNEDGTFEDCHNTCEKYIAESAERKADKLKYNKVDMYVKHVRNRNKNHYSKLGTIENKRIDR